MYRFALVFLLALTFSSHSFGQKANERILKKQSIKKIQKNIEINQKKGLIPTDLAVVGKGRFTVLLRKPKQPLRWQAEFELSDEQFDKLFSQNCAKQMRLIAHEIYENKKKRLHACIWHFDQSYVVPSEDELIGTAPRPKARPLGIIWEPEAVIPVVGAQGGPYAAFEQKVVDYMKTNQIPAISVAYAIKSRPVYQASFGYADLDRLEKATPENSFRTVWVSRLITAIATLQLVEQGVLKLDQPVYPLLGIKPWQPSTVDSRSNQITIKQLLQQTAGYDHSTSINPLYDISTVAAKMKAESPTADQVVAFMLSQPLSFEPGTKRVHSDYSYFLLGRVIQKVTGKSYEEFVLEKIAKPIGLKSLSMSHLDPDLESGSSATHYARHGIFYKKLHGKEKGKWTQLGEGGGRRGDLIGSSGGWLASPIDMLALGNDLQAKRSKLLSADAKGLLAAMPDYQLEAAIAAKPSQWHGMGLVVNRGGEGLDFWMRSVGGCATNNLVCYSSGNMRCYMMNCASTISGVSVIDSFKPVINAGFKVATQVNKR